MSKIVNETTMSDSFRHKLWELAKELEKYSSVNAQECYRKLFNKDRTGLIDKLKDDLNFDIIAIAGEDEAEQQSAAELLAMLFDIEKEEKFKIIDFLNHPSMQNLIYSHTSSIKKQQYFWNSKAFTELVSEIRNYIPDADEIDTSLEQINWHWEFETRELFSYVLSDHAIEEPESAMAELERIEYFLTDKILPKLPDSIPETISHESIMKDFYTILLCHKLKCADSDRISLNYEILTSPAPSEEYTQLHKKYEIGRISLSEIEKFKEYLFSTKKNKPLVPEYDTLLQLISYQNGFQATEKNAYKFAFDNFMTVVTWWFQRYPTWAKQEGADPFSSVPLGEQLTEIPRNTFTNVMQELIFIAQDKTKITNKYYKYKNANVSLRKSIIKPDEADTKAICALVDRLENREAVNWGNSALIQKKRDIEILFYRVKSFIYSYHNLEDIKLADSIIAFHIFRAIVSDEAATKKGNDFSYRTISKIDKDVTVPRFIVSSGALNIQGMFKEFLCCPEESEEAIACQIAQEINHFYKEETTETERILNIPVQIKYSENYINEYSLQICLSKTENTLCFRGFLMVFSDEKIAYAKSLGLSKFFC